MRKFNTFNGPYILIEDANNKHQPFFKEYNDVKIPQMYFSGEALGCPFLKNYNAKRQKPKKNNRKTGFCEICCVKFSDYGNHINEQDHKNVCNNEEQYKEIDDLIDEFKAQFISEESENYGFVSSPTVGKRPDHYNQPSSFLSFMSNKNDSGVSVYILSGGEHRKRMKHTVDNVSDLFRVNTSD